MSTNHIPLLLTAVFIGLFASDASAAKKKKDKKKPIPVVELNEKGKQLEASYATEMEKLQREIQAAVVIKDGEDKAACLKAVGAVKNAHESISKLKRSKDPKAHNKASKDLNDAKAQRSKVFAEMNFGDLIDDGISDKSLYKFVVLKEATPRGLAEFAQQSPKHEALIDSLLSDAGLMHDMLVADGAKRPRIGHAMGPAQYGRAMEIYSQILKEAPNSKEKVLHEDSGMTIGFQIQRT